MYHFTGERNAAFISLEVKAMPQRTNPSEYEVDGHLVFYAQSTSMGHIRVKQNVLLPQIQILIGHLYEVHRTPLGNLFV